MAMGSEHQSFIGYLWKCYSCGKIFKILIKLLIILEYVFDSLPLFLMYIMSTSLVTSAVCLWGKNYLDSNCMWLFISYVLQDDTKFIMGGGLLEEQCHGWNISIFVTSNGIDRTKPRKPLLQNTRFFIFFDQNQVKLWESKH